MSIIIRLQNLSWSATSLDIRRYFQGQNIPEGGVHIVGGEKGDAFIAFSTDEDARQAMEKDGGKLKEMKIKLMLSSRAEMQRVIEQARTQTLAPPVVTISSSPPPAPIQVVAVKEAPISTRDHERSKKSPEKRRSDRSSREKSRDRERERSSKKSSSRRSRSRSPRRRDKERDNDRRSSKRDERRKSEERARTKEENVRIEPEPVKRSSNSNTAQGGVTAPTSEPLFPAARAVASANLDGKGSGFGRGFDSNQKTDNSWNSPFNANVSVSGGDSTNLLKTQVNTLPAIGSAFPANNELYNANRNSSFADSSYSSKSDNTFSGMQGKLSETEYDSLRNKTDKRMGGDIRNMPNMMESRNMPNMMESRNMPNMMESRNMPNMMESRNMPNMMESRNISDFRGMMDARGISDSGISSGRSIMDSIMSGNRGNNMSTVGNRNMAEPGMLGRNSMTEPGMLGRNSMTETGMLGRNSMTEPGMLGRNPMTESGILSGRDMQDMGGMGMSQRLGQVDMRFPDSRSMVDHRNMSDSRGLPMTRGMQDMRVMPDQRNVLDSRGMPDQRNTPDSRGMADQRNMPDSRGLPDQRNMSESRGMHDQRNMPDSRGMPDQRNMPNSRGMPDQRNMPDSRGMPDPRNMPDSRGMPDQRNMPDSRGMPDQRNMPESRRMADSRNLGDKRPHSDSRGMMDSRGSKDSRGMMDTRDSRGMRDQKGLRNSREMTDNKGISGGDSCEMPDSRGSHEGPEQRRNESANFNKRNTDPDQKTCVEMRGLPLLVVYSDIRDFFRGISIPSDGIKIINNEQGQRTGVAYVRFQNERDRFEGLKRTGNRIETYSVTLGRVSYKTFDEAIDSFLPPGMEPPKPSNRPKKEETCVMMKGLPFMCKESDIAEFFNGIRTVDMFIEYDSTGRSRGMAFVEFSCVADVKEALTRNGNSMGRRYIEVSITSKEAMESVRAQMATEKISMPKVNMEPLVTHCMAVHGLPFNVIDRQLADFFGEVGYIPHAIHMMLGPNGKPTGDAYIEFNSPKDCEAGMIRNGHLFGNQAIQLVPIPCQEMMTILNGTSGSPPDMPQDKVLGADFGRNMRPGKPLIDSPILDGPRGPLDNPRNTMDRPRGLDNFPGPADNRMPPENFHGHPDMQRGHPDGFRGQGDGPRGRLDGLRGRPDGPRGHLDNSRGPMGSLRGHLDNITGHPDSLLGSMDGVPRGGQMDSGRGRPLLDEVIDRGRLPLLDNRDRMMDPRGSHRDGPFGDPDDMMGEMGRPRRNMEGKHNGRPLLDMDEGHFIPDDNRLHDNLPRGRMYDSRGFNDLSSGMSEDHMGPRMPPGPGMRGSGPKPYRGRAPGPPMGMRNAGPPGPEGFGRPGCVLGATNIPWRATMDDILSFFNGFGLSQENVIRRYDGLGRPTGDARISFHLPDDAQRALNQLNGLEIGGRTVSLFIP